MMGRDDRDSRRSRERDRSRSRSTERDVLEICWKPVREEPTNFDAWTHLLQTVEQLDETKPARQAYDEFLTKFPFCYGYWRKYAELERRHKHMERAIDVYERGVQCIPLSIDLWSSYLNLYKEHMKDSENRVKKVRYLYERAISTAGLEFRSDKLWESYINWEIENNNYPQALSLFDRVLKVPTLLYASHFDKLQEFVNNNPPDKILPDEEYEDLFKEIERDVKDKGGAEVYVVEEVAVDDPEYMKLTDENGIKLEPQAQYKKRYNDDALKQFRVAIIDKRRKWHLYTEQEVSKRWTYEEGIKRPYFHVKPLERAQLKNWRSYLDFEMQTGNEDRIQYSRWLEKNGDIEGARETYKRACTIHLPKKPLPTLAWCALEEAQGKDEVAAAILSDFDRRVPGLLQVQLRRLGLERRVVQRRQEERPDFSAVSSRYEKILRDPSTPVKTLSFFAIKFARFHAKIRNDKRLAEKILLDALNRDERNPVLYLQLVDLAYNTEPMNENSVVDAMDKALHSTLPDQEKLRFSQRKLEFLEDFTLNVPALQEHFEYHLKLAKSLGIPSSGQKRKAPSTENNADPEANDKKHRTEAESNSGNAAAPDTNTTQSSEYASYYSYNNTSNYYPPQTNTSVQPQQGQTPQQPYYYQANQQGQQGGSYYYAPPY